jgi:hypothetical protein
LGGWNLTAPVGPDWLRSIVGHEVMLGYDDVDFVYLSGTQVTDAVLVHLKDLTKLQSLHLSDTRVTDAGLVHLKDLTNFQSLGLFGTQVTDAGLVHLKDLTKLQSLGLCGTQVTDAGLMHLKDLTKLQSLRPLVHTGGRCRAGAPEGPDEAPIAAPSRTHGWPMPGWCT